MNKRYTLYTFPKGFGTPPRHFKWKWCAWLCAIFTYGVCELEDHHTGEYHSFWV